MNLIIAIAISCLLPMSLPVHSFSKPDSFTNDTLLHLSKDFLLAKEKSYQQNASEKDVETVLSFCNDSVHYEHILSPEKKFSFTGKEVWRKGMIAHLGETRNAKIKILNFIQKQNVVVVEFRLTREIKANNNWEKSTATTVSIIEFDSDRKISRLTDYL